MNKKSNSNLEDILKVGLIQTVINDELAWKYPATLNMKEIVKIKVWQQIKKGFCSLKNHKSMPEIVILPELTLPQEYILDLKKISETLGIIILAGLDFEKIKDKYIRNKAIIIIPQNWPKKERANKSSIINFGKTFFSQDELDFFEKLNYEPFPDPVTYIFNAGPFGNIGVAICSDFFDIERFVIYRGKIHHMLVIAFNRDANSYDFLANAISRLVYCNVVICNTGRHGDSLAYSPYNKPYERIIYKHSGKNLFNTQVIELPVKSLDDAQNGNDSNKIFKARPPGYQKMK